MFIAHLPAGYLLADQLTRGRPQRSALFYTGLICSILPDMDLLWFYLVDNRQTPHHAYLFHWPLFWVGIASLATAFSWISGRAGAMVHVKVGLACLLLHLALDSVVGRIGWLQPLWDWHLTLVAVPPRYTPWVWNFILHWTFLIELSICMMAFARLLCIRQSFPVRQLRR